ncbi:MAG TPA: site-specific DNA-methyltransferase [Archaeoglobus sp.]|nr:site-specific DNA-methyltransferase [Archaeoglobus sp.]
MGAIAPDVITINTEPFPDAHFAVFPERLVEFLIKVGCPEQVCRMCGKPYKKEYEKIDISNLVDWRYYGANEKGEYHGQAIKDCESAEAQNPSDVKRRILQGLRKGVVFKEYKPTCNCNASTEGGIVLDPFLGSGTTALVALKMGRRFIGIEINRSYCEMALKRIEPYLKQATLESFVRW